MVIAFVIGNCELLWYSTRSDQWWWWWWWWRCWNDAQWTSQGDHIVKWRVTPTSPVEKVTLSNTPQTSVCSPLFRGSDSGKELSGRETPSWAFYWTPGSHCFLLHLQSPSIVKKKNLNWCQPEMFLLLCCLWEKQSFPSPTNTHFNLHCMQGVALVVSRPSHDDHVTPLEWLSIDREDDQLTLRRRMDDQMMVRRPERAEKLGDTSLLLLSAGTSILTRSTNINMTTRARWEIQNQNWARLTWNLP